MINADAKLTFPIFIQFFSQNGLSPQITQFIKYLLDTPQANLLDDSIKLPITISYEA